MRRVSDARSPEIPIHNEHMRPGFCRVSLPFFMSESELAFVLEALKMVATEAWKILPQYIVNPETGQWRHHSCAVLRDMKSLHSVRYHDGKMTAYERRVSGKNHELFLFYFWTRVCDRPENRIQIGDRGSEYVLEMKCEPINKNTATKSETKLI